MDYLKLLLEIEKFHIRNIFWNKVVLEENDIE